jgi:hypothetical protein
MRITSGGSDQGADLLLYKEVPLAPGASLGLQQNDVYETAPQAQLHLLPPPASLVREGKLRNSEYSFSAR